MPSPWVRRMLANEGPDSDRTGAVKAGTQCSHCGDVFETPQERNIHLMRRHVDRRVAYLGG